MRRVSAVRSGKKSLAGAAAFASLAAAAALLAGCSSEFDRQKAQVDVQETYDLFTDAVFAGDGAVACSLMTDVLLEEQFGVGPSNVVPEGGSCEAQMARQGKLLIRENGGTRPTTELEDIQVSPVADDGSQPFSPGGIVAWAETQSVLEGEPEPMRFFLIREDWLIGSLPPSFVPSPVLGGAPREGQADEPQ